MAITKQSAYQEQKTKYVDIAFGDLATGVQQVAIDLPPNAIVLSGDVVVTTAFNSQTTDALVVGDVSSANRYLSISASQNSLALGRTALVPTGFVTTMPVSNSSVALTWTCTGNPPTTGALRLTVNYIQKNLAEGAQSSNDAWPASASASSV